jgi:hypothetical protein
MFFVKHILLIIILITISYAEAQNDPENSK